MAQNAKATAKGKKSAGKATSHHSSGAKNLKDKDKKATQAVSSSKSEASAKGKKAAATPLVGKKGATSAKADAKSVNETSKGAGKKGEKEAASKGKEAKKSKFCSEPGCTLLQMNDQFCRLHYIKNWNTIISSRRAQARANLNKYIESLSEKYPDEYMEKIRDDIGNNEGAFHARLRELGFREEYESSGGGDNPFQMENFDEFVHGLKFEE